MSKHRKPKLYRIDWFLFGMGIAYMTIGTCMMGAAMELHPSWRNVAIGVVLFGMFSAMFLTEGIRKVDGCE